MYYYQIPVTKTRRGAYYYIETSKFRRYVPPLDVKERKIPDIFPQLPTEINTKIWHYKMQMECLTERWDSFLMSLTATQYKLFTLFKQSCVRPRGYLKFALRNFEKSSRIYKKAVRQLLNY